MAVGDIRLSTDRYVRPGVYIGRVPQPQEIAVTGNPRYPCFVGRAHRLKRVSGANHIRARVYEEQLNFTTVAPYIAYLDHKATNDKSISQIVTSSGEPLSTNYWTFLESDSVSGEYDRVQIDDTVFDKTTTYYITYQSVDRDVLDPLNFDDLRRMIYVGDTDGQAKYVEFVDYRIVTRLVGNTNDSDAASASSNNKYTSGSTSTITQTGTGSASVSFSSSSSYTYPYTRQYVLTAQNVSGTAPNCVVEFKISVTHNSGGNSATPNVPFHTSASEAVVKVDQGGVSGTVSLSLNNTDVTGPPAITWLKKFPSYWEWDGLTLEIDFSGGNFVNGDTVEYTGYGPGLVEFSSAHDNSNQFSEVNDPVGNSSNTSAAKITVNSKTDYDDEYDRSYYFEVTAAGGSAPNRTATVLWAGHKELPFSEGTLTLNEGSSTTYQEQLLEHGIYVDIVWGAEHSTADTVNTISSADATTLSSAITLATEIKSDYNKHDNNTGGTFHAAGSGAHQISAADPTDFDTLRTLCLDIQTQFAAHLSDTTEHVVADTINSVTTAITSTSSLSELVSFLNTVKSLYTKHIVATGFVVGDSWTMDALAPRREYTAKDERSYEITVNSVVANTSLTFTYHTGTYEGWWGTGTIDANGGSWVDTNADFPDGIRLMFRNLETTERYDANDVFTFSTVCDDKVDWSLVRRANETISSSDIRQDVLGTVTGTPLSYYLVLNETPTNVLRVEEDASGDALVYTHINGTPYISFSTDPGVDVKVKYEWRGYEPDPGNTYFITADRLRADSEFNTPIRLLSVDEARAELYPTATTNHLWIATEIAFETNMFGCYVVPVQSASGDEQFSLADYKTAIDASETNQNITDLVVLSYFDALGHAKISINNMNDPFVGAPRLLWVGAPRGTNIGDENTPDTLVYLARNTLQFGPQEAGKGNVILIGNTTCSRTIQLEDGSTTKVDLDGSFIAAYAAAKTAEFTDPASTLLRTSTSSFDEMEEFTEKEEDLLGNASITFLTSIGSGLYEFAESVTVDTTEVALNEISARTQEHYVLRRVRRELDDALTGFVPPSAAAGQLLIQSKLVQSLGTMASSNVIAPYGTEESPPTPRQIDPAKDVYVFVDPVDQRLYHFGYYFVTRLPIKRMFGLYSVNTRFWSSAAEKTGTP